MKSRTKPAGRVVSPAQVQITLPVQGVLQDVGHAFYGLRHRAGRGPGFDDKITALYAHGMCTRDMQAHVRELYGIEVSPDLVSAVRFR